MLKIFILALDLSFFIRLMIIYVIALTFCADMPAITTETDHDLTIHGSCVKTLYIV